MDKYTWVAEGSSYVLSDLLAAVLDAQLDKFDEIQSRRGRIVERYRAGLLGWAQEHGVRLPAQLPGRESNHHVFFLLFPDEASRDVCLGRLRAQGVMATFHYVPLHSSPQGRALGFGDMRLPVTDRVASGLVRLPLHPLLGDGDVDRVIDAVCGSDG